MKRSSNRGSAHTIFPDRIRPAYRQRAGGALSDHGNFGFGLAAWTASLFVALSLLEECRRWCERALAVLDAAGRGTRQEMILQEALALSSMYTRGHSDQARAAIERGIALAEALEDRVHQLRLLAGLNFFLIRLGDPRAALAAAERGGAIAQGTTDRAGLISAEWMLGMSHHFVGNQAAAQLHCERGLMLAAELGTFNANYFGVDQRIRGLVALARALWLRGFSDRALRIAQMSIDEAASQDHPVSICVSLVYSPSVFLWSGDLLRAGDSIEQLIAYAGRYSMKPFRAVGVALKGELAVNRDEAEAGLDLLRSALEILNVDRYHVLFTTFMGALADGLRKTGQFEEALFTINGAIARATNSGAEFNLSELLRIKSQILAARDDRGSAVTCLTDADLKTARALLEELG
jgi:tetratricopeptide (TPR) repeat protein